jgi:uncharacterized protein YqgV (UPF0045/DUF77 family)
MNKRIYYIPVNTLSPEEAIKNIQEIMNKNYDNVEINIEIDIPKEKREEREKKLKRILNV